MHSPDPAAARAAHHHARNFEQQILTRWPDAWTNMDRMRRESSTPWPEWCLLPMGAAIAATDPTAPIAQVSALYAWRYSRAVYQVHPALMSRLLTQVPDDIGLDQLTSLPHWCVYITDSHPKYPGSGLWAHLEHDINTGRPELRLLLDFGEEEVGHHQVVPVYLDRPSVTEALADYRATALAQLTSPPGANVRGGLLDDTVAQYANQIDGYLAVLAYLARPEADIQCVGRPGLRPVRPRSPVHVRTVWAVGYGG